MSNLDSISSRRAPLTALDGSASMVEHAPAGPIYDGLDSIDVVETHFAAPNHGDLITVGENPIGRLPPPFPVEPGTCVYGDGSGGYATTIFPLDQSPGFSVDVGWCNPGLAGGRGGAGISTGAGPLAPGRTPSGTSQGAKPPFSTSTFKEWTNLDGRGGAGETRAREAYLAMENSGSSARDRREYGALIFQWNGRTFTTPLVEGRSLAEGQGTAAVDFNDMIKALPPPSAGITIVGMVHAHPLPGAFSHPDDPDVVSANRLRGREMYGPYKLDFRVSFIAAPTSESMSSPRVASYYPQR